MSSDSRQASDSPAGGSPGNDSPMDAAARSAAETFLLPTAGTPDKQDQDIALAAELLRSGLLSDRQLSAAMGEWSVHGSVPLADHLRERQALSDDQIDQLKQRATASASATVSNSSSNLSGSVSLVETLDKFDETGRVARLLGVSVVSGATDTTRRESDVRYQLIRKLGQGGLGRVWLARDLHLQRLVALKEITDASKANETTIARFRHEAEITGRLEHPGIVPVHQLGDDAETGFTFYTMRFLGKSTLQDSIAEYHERREEGDEDPMLLRHLLTAFVNICHAIGHAHSRKVIHRDLKPENVVIDSFGQVIVIDWGLAKVLDEAAVEQLGAASSLSGDGSGTVEGQVMGTPLYMAPEQAAGRLDEVDTRTDIYGLGTILFAIITGYAPHEQTQAKALQNGGGARQLISAIVSGPTPTAVEINKHVDAALAAVCSKAMARKRYARYQTASALAEEVQRWMADEPVTAYEEPPMMQLRRWIHRHERMSQVVGALAAVLLAAMVTLGVSARQNQLSEQQSRFQQMRGDAREIELQLRNAAADLSADVRFMSGLPPIQGIIRAQADVAGEDPETWRSRLETIYTGLLRAEPGYLAVAFVAAEDGGARELVRVERSLSDPTLLRVLPATRLRFFEVDPFLDEVLEQEPGETLMSIDPRPWQSEKAAQARRLTIAVPVYAETTGAAFGMVAIETDVTRDVEAILDDLGVLYGNVYLTNSEGVIWTGAKVGGGSTDKWNGRSIAEFVPGAMKAFDLESGETETDDGVSFIAKRVQIDPNSDGSGIIVARPDIE